MLPGSCPCNECNWFVTDSLGNISSIIYFNVCSSNCDQNDSVSCEDDPQCADCLNNTGNIWSRSGWTWPFTITSRCDDDPLNIHEWSNILGHNFCFANRFSGFDNACRQCHWFVTDLSGKSSLIEDFEVCKDDTTPVSCEDDPQCADCLDNTGDIWSRSGWTWPFTVTSRCDDDPSNIHEWSNILGHNFCFANRFSGFDNACRQCHRFVTDSSWIGSSTKDFEICKGNIDTYSCENDPLCRDRLDDTGSLWIRSGWTAPFKISVICEDSEWIVFEQTNITGHNFCFANRLSGSCNPYRQCHRWITDALGLSSSIGDFKVSSNNCNNDCKWDPFCLKCIDDPDDCIRFDWEWPTDITVNCETDLIYHWSGVYWSMFPVAHMFPWSCDPYRQCNWIAVNWSGISTWTFQVYDPECESHASWWNIVIGWETPIDFGNIDSSIISECNSCPCNYADFANSLNINDKVKALLWDDSKSTIYNQSVPVFLKEFLEM